MVENLNKLEAAFLAGRIDAEAEERQIVPECVDHLLRMVLSESDCAALARLSKVLFHSRADQSLRLVPSAVLPSSGARNGAATGA